ncbi:hypothetical protein [Euzebya tangerina]|uniref:hypothetical protein n=1 Tax=Euzebya tangerina TaxID=591198 RepID=UPI000E31BF9E|nr:hypothetical protein [Euzebya tangerina]
MIPIVLVSVALGAVVLWALYADPTPLEPVSRPRRLVSPLSAADIQRHDAPLVVAGYDPRWIDHHLRQIASLVTMNGQQPVTAASAADLAAARAAAALHDDAPRSVLDD